MCMCLLCSYDDGTALAHGLDKLLHHDGIGRDDITGYVYFIPVNTYSSFEGASGHGYVLFLSNGDRRSGQIFRIRRVQLPRD